MLNITDLDHLEAIAETGNLSGGATATISATALASGTTASALAITQSTNRQLPHNGSLSIAQGRAFAFATDPDAAVFVGVSGDADGEITKEITTSKIIHKGGVAVGHAVGIMIAITPPSP